MTAAPALGPLAALVTRPLVLASASPRRRDLLRAVGLEVRVVAPPPESEQSWVEGAGAVAHVRAQAASKARAVAQRLRADVAADVLAADTIVVLDDRVLEKPRDAAEARAMLRQLSGRTHHVFTAVALAATDGDALALEVEDTRVTFALLDAEQIECYVATGEPLDKAGAYGIQGHAAVFVHRIDGCYFNVVGLPLSRVYAMLQAWRSRGAEDLRGPR